LTIKRLILDFRGVFSYNVNMRTKYNLKEDEEVIVTVAQIIDIVEGIASISNLIDDEIKNMPPEKQRKATITILALFTVVARLFPSKQRKLIFKDLKEVCGVDLMDLL